jgi:hypothetical protein
MALSQATPLRLCECRRGALTRGTGEAAVLRGEDRILADLASHRVKDAASAAYPV